MARPIDRPHPFAVHLPLTRVVARSGPVTLRLPNEDELVEYCDRLADGALDDDHTRATLKWQPASPEEAARQTLAHVGEALTRGPGPDWLLPLFVFADGKPIGRQDIAAERDFAHLGLVKTGSVLLPHHRGQGHGTHARACALALAWKLGAARALTGWRSGNEASARVSAKLGYVPNGVTWWWDGLTESVVEIQRAWVDPDRFRAAWPAPVDVVGVDAATRAWIR